MDESFMIHNVQTSLEFMRYNMDRARVWALCISLSVGHRV